MPNFGLILKTSKKIPGVKYITNFSNKVSRTIWNYTPRDIKGATAKLRNPVKRGIKKSKKENTSVFTAVAREYKGVKFAKSEYPALAASAVALTPIPSPIPIFPLVYGLGKLIYKSPVLFSFIPKIVQKGIQSLI